MRCNGSPFSGSPIYKIHKDPATRRLYKSYNVSYYLATTKPLFNVSEFQILKSHFLIIKEVIVGLPQDKQDPTSISINLYLMADKSEMRFLSECDMKIYGAFQESLAQILWQLKRCLLLGWDYKSFFPNEAFTAVAEEAITKILSIDYDLLF